MFDPELLALANEFLTLARAEAVTLATAESCTGGMIAALLTEISGSSSVVDRAFVTYSNEAKAEMLGVPDKLIAEQGAVSEAVARAMIAGVLAVSPVRLAIAVTGVAGPTGGTPLKPIGRVHIAAARRDGLVMHRQMDYGNRPRGEIRRLTVRDALTIASHLIAPKALA